MVLFSSPPAAQRNATQEQWNNFHTEQTETAVAAGIRATIQQATMPLTPTDLTFMAHQQAHQFVEVLSYLKATLIF